MSKERTSRLGADSLDKLADDLAYAYDGVIPRDEVDAVVRESFDLLSQRSKITDFLVVLTRRFARERLAARAATHGVIRGGVPEALFICVRNAGRSQMAAALMQHRSEGRVHVRSAGSDPGDGIHPVVTEAMAEIGVALTEAFPKPLTDDVVRASDVIVTMGCGDTCPVYPGKRYLDWDLADPHGKPLAEVRVIRDEIDRRVGALLGEMLHAPTT